ncbi:hypothetical protein Mal4_29220 [Maioricimonas rarisocia]|uniref:Twin-arginine translocation signal domain-containing protein n=1 Tax=Maioricimonas rarisocia TaxID=2528026 RepID=A0A517Z7Z4_9PLAN|nr:hypothetical protein [Maioricimonas rarisocia]QDU38593.1 hypothetical protein Mal4_29220 [Maioricimonas rarisocia]
MSFRPDRRRFLQTGAGSGALLGLGDLSFLSGLNPVSAAEAKEASGAVQLRPEIEPVVRMIEETPRERLLEEVAARIQGGLSYREVLAGLLLAGVKNVEPRPSVGFKFHAVLVVNSAHLASLASPPEHRWMPIFWALDYYKNAAARDVRERGDWTMSRVSDSSLPAAHNAHTVFSEAMENWDEQAADSAVAQLARTAGSHEIYEMLFRYGARDFRSIGHKAIFVANSYRTLQCIGWEHAEPVLRSLAYALLMHEGDNPASRDADADRPYRKNVERVAKIRSDWRDGALDPGATTALLSTLRTGSNDDACEQVVELLNSGASPQSIWDAFHVASGELLMRQSGIVALHAVTTTNAMAFAFQTCSNDETRRLLMLQNAAFLPMFREAMENRGDVKDVKIDELVESREEGSVADVDEIFAEVSGNPSQAARQVVRFLNETGDANRLIDAARVLVFLKGNDAHDYKFSSAVLEDYYHVSPQWRDVYLASNVFKLQGSSARDNSLVERTRAAFAT